MENLKTYIENIARLVEFAGVVTIVLGALLAMARFLLFSQKSGAYKLLRRELGKAILLGLEILVAADIISTVVTEPTMERVLTLGLIVLIRTFLSFSLEVEIEGRFPWSKAGNTEENNTAE